ADVLSGLTSVTTQGHLHVLRPDGSQVCSLRAPDVADRPIPPGDWFARVRADHGPVNGGVAVDALSGHVAITVALPIDGAGGAVGVLAAVLYTDTVLDLPAGASSKMVLIEVDGDRRLVVGTSANAPVKAGPVTAGWLARPLGAGTRTVRDVDGVTRLYRELDAPDIGWHVLAGLPRSVALASAERELHRNLWVALAVLLVVTGLGLVLHRRLARPVRRLRAAIEAASSNDTVRAPGEGPALEGRGRGHVAVAFMDLDRFKLINDSKGHPAGDAVLVALARRLERAVRSDDTIARFGGDEFVVVAEGNRSDGDVAAVAERLAAVLREPFFLG